MIFLKKNNISTTVKKNQELPNQLYILFNRKANPKIIQNKLKMIGNKILKKTYDEIFVG